MQKSLKLKSLNRSSLKNSKNTYLFEVIGKVLTEIPSEAFSCLLLAQEHCPYELNSSDKSLMCLKRGIKKCLQKQVEMCMLRAG